MPIRYSSVVGGSSSSGFNLDIGSSGNTTFEFDTPQPAGGYSITSQLADSTVEFYAIAEDGTLAGYTNTKSLTATQDFDTMVVYGATNNDLITFEFKPTTLPTANGDQDSGAAPFLTSATPTTLASVDDTTTVTGGNFANNVEIVFTGQDDVDRAAKNIVRSNSTSLIVTRPDAFPVEQEPFTMTATNAGITNPSTNVNKLTDYFDAGSGIVWVTTSPLPTAIKGAAYSTTLEATDADVTSVAYSLTAGSLPTGLSLNGSTGAISGTPTAEESQTFTITATDAGGNTSAREFTLGVIQPALEYLVIAGGGGGGEPDRSGGGGAGGYRSSVIGESSGGGATAESTFSIETGTNYTVTIGAGGAGGISGAGNDGSDTIFSNITSIGGGGGAGHGEVAKNGGSGGGRRTVSGSASGSGTANQGFDGGAGTDTGGNSAIGGGGGGAGSAGANGTPQGNGNGGNGVSSSITGSAIGRAGGGGGGGFDNPGGVATDGGGSGGSLSAPNGDGQDNTGGGGGGDGTETQGGNGGSGVVIIKYPDTLTISVGAGLTANTPPASGGYKVTTFSAGDDTIIFS